MFCVSIVSLPPVRHGILGVHHQVHQDLFKLSGIGRDVRRLSESRAWN